VLEAGRVARYRAQHRFTTQPSAAFFTQEPLMNPQSPPPSSPQTPSLEPTPGGFSRRPNPERLGLGLIVVAVGVVFLLDNLKLLSLSAALPFWPVILLALGALKLACARQTGGGVWGVVLMGAGGVEVRN
jgi:hypothetical protein